MLVIAAVYIRAIESLQKDKSTVAGVAEFDQYYKTKGGLVEVVNS